ncbi:hypothetical protein ACS0TY_023379 [Phlomoides rotata]
MQPGETIAQLDIRFTNIMNENNSLGKEFAKGDVTLKILRSLHEKWDIFTVMFQNTKDLYTISSEQMFSELQAHEFNLNRRKPTATATAPEEATTLSKGATFKVKSEECDSPTRVVHDLSKDEMLEEMNLMDKRFARLILDLGSTRSTIRIRGIERGTSITQLESQEKGKIRTRDVIVIKGTQNPKVLHQGTGILSQGRMMKRMSIGVTSASGHDTSSMIVLI